MTVADKAKQAILERVIVLAKDADITGLTALTDTIGKMTGETTKPMNVMADAMAKIMEYPSFDKSAKEAKGEKK